jgi:hypothetical protein
VDPPGVGFNDPTPAAPSAGTLARPSANSDWFRFSLRPTSGVQRSTAPLRFDQASFPAPVPATTATLGLDSRRAELPGAEFTDTL